jgi:hypothetical protein
MRFIFLSRWRYAVAVLTIVAVFATSTQTFAQSSQSGESGEYVPENIGPLVHGDPNDSPFRSLQTQTDYSEARNGAGTLLRVWRANEDPGVAAPVWMAWGNGDGPFQLGNTATYVNPVVVPLGPSFWMVFHTGTDGSIYYTVITSPNAGLNGAIWGNSWQRIPFNQTTNMAVSAVQYRTSGAVFVAYRGSGGDPQVYGTWFDGGGWEGVEEIGDGEAVSSPSVTYNPVSDELWVTASGLDNAVWFTHQQIGDNGWPNWSSFDRLTQAPPQIAATTDGRMTVSFVDTAGHPNYRTFDVNLNPQTDWTVDTTGWVTRNAVALVAVGLNLYSLFIGTNNVGYWKQLRN